MLWMKMSKLVNKDGNIILSTMCINGREFDGNISHIHCQRQNEFVWMVWREGISLVSMFYQIASGWTFGRVPLTWIPYCESSNRRSCNSGCSQRSLWGSHHMPHIIASHRSATRCGRSYRNCWTDSPDVGYLFCLSANTMTVSIYAVDILMCRSSYYLICWYVLVV